MLAVSALKLNTGVRELYLADNGLESPDGFLLGSLLRINNNIQLLDIRCDKNKTLSCYTSKF